MVRNHFGHVGDSASPEQRMVADIKVPNFDQAQVDYLTKIFEVTVLPQPQSLDDVVKNTTMMAKVFGAKEVIDHIQFIIDRRKAEASK